MEELAAPSIRVYVVQEDYFCIILCYLKFLFITI